MGIKIKQVDGLQDALDNAGGGSGQQYYLSTFSATGAESDAGPGEYETTMDISDFGLYDPVFFTGKHSGDGYVCVNGIKVKETYYNPTTQKLNFFTDYPVDETDLIQYTVLWDGQSGE